MAKATKSIIIIFAIMNIIFAIIIVILAQAGILNAYWSQTKGRKRT